eukprot:Em0004g1595a
MEALVALPHSLPLGVEIPNRVFVGGLPYNMTELQMKEFFSQFGNVRDCKIITDRAGLSKGYGFVTFESEDEATQVFMLGSLFYREKKLNVAKAVRRHGGQFTKANQEYVTGLSQMYWPPMGGAQVGGASVAPQPSGMWYIEPQLCDQWVYGTQPTCQVSFGHIGTQLHYSHVPYYSVPPFNCAPFAGSHVLHSQISSLQDAYFPWHPVTATPSRPQGVQSPPPPPLATHQWDHSRPG